MEGSDSSNLFRSSDLGVMGPARHAAVIHELTSCISKERINIGHKVVEMLKGYSLLCTWYFFSIFHIPVGPHLVVQLTSPDPLRGGILLQIGQI